VFSYSNPRDRNSDQLKENLPSSGFEGWASRAAQKLSRMAHLIQPPEKFNLLGICTSFSDYSRGLGLPFA
jgi:hypothetical protein